MIIFKCKFKIERKGKMKKRNGFTLVELLAVIVILAIILVIAVPQIINTIRDSKISSFKSSAMMVASAAETQYLTAKLQGKVKTGKPTSAPAEGDFYLGGSAADAQVDCSGLSWTGLNSTDYNTCTYYIDTTNGKAHVSLTGKTTGKFKGCTTSDATKTSATVNDCQ